MLHEQLDRLGGNAVALDIGCGRGVARQAEPIQRIASKCKVLWGVEPDTSITHAPCFEKVWQTTLEDADIPDSSVDLAFSYFVIEHIVSRLRAFAEKLHRILKPVASSLPRRLTRSAYLPGQPMCVGPCVSMNSSCGSRMGTPRRMTTTIRRPIR